MASDDCHSVNCALLENECEQSNPSELEKTLFISSRKINVNWSGKQNGSTSSQNNYRSSYQQGFLQRSSKTLSESSIASFSLFRYFNLKYKSWTGFRIRFFFDENKSISSSSSEKISAPPRLEIRHIMTTILITILSVTLLVLMIILDIIYLNDSITPMISADALRNKTRLCFRYPTICFVKGLVITVFLSITILLCCSVLRLYTRAKRHSLLLERKTHELEKEKCLTQKLLHQILPPCVARDLINGRQAPAEYYDSVTVYFSDIVGFTTIASNCSPTETCDMLNQLYSIFDALLENFDVYKVETIGDAYMVVSGAPNKNGNRHPNEIINMALALIHGKQHVKVPRSFAELQLRVGIHTGPVCAAVIGSKMPRYCMFGDTVNVANRMESTGLPEHIHLSEDTYENILDREQYIFQERGEIDIKGKGLMRTYFLCGKRLDQMNAENQKVSSAL